MKIIVFILILFLSFGLLNSGESPYPQIKSLEHQIEYRDGTKYVDFIWQVEIQGKRKSYRMLLEIIIYDEEENELKRFESLIDIQPKELQIFGERRMIQNYVAQNLNKVGANLSFLQKKY
jgi:hypothetical protein